MANENFGLGYTVVDFATYHEVGLSGITDRSPGGHTNIYFDYADVSGVTVNGGHTNIYVDYFPIGTTSGPAISFSASGICSPPQILAGSPTSVLSGPGSQQLSTC